jgi:DNA-binding LacI/PurR family transcriptional regulator
VIIMPGGLSLDDLAAAARGNLPIMLCNWEERDGLPALPMVGVDFFEAGCVVAHHLLALGHRRIGVVADTSVPYTRHSERVAGFAATMAAAGIVWDTALLRAGDSSIASGYQAVQSLCALPEPPSAIFCIAAEATALLLRGLGGGGAPAAHAVQHPATLVERRSTAPAGPPVPVPAHIGRERSDAFRALLDQPLPTG